MNIHELIKNELNDEQLAAVTEMQNCVVAAGAGSGKTRVLAYRYAHLVIEHNYPVESILTLTFTKKATAEMYDRIYTTLCKISNSESSSEHQKARANEAIENFHNCRIQTIDSFCSNVVRSSSRLYGIKPNFTIDNDAVFDFCKKLALSYMLKYRKLSPLQDLIDMGNLEDVGEALFVNPIMKHSNIALESDYMSFIELQVETIIHTWNVCIDSILSTKEILSSYNSKANELFIELERHLITSSDLLVHFNALKNINKYEEQVFYIASIKSGLISFVSAVYKLSKISKPRSEKIEGTKDAIDTLRNEYSTVTSLTHYLLYFPQSQCLLPLLNDYQSTVTEWKRSTGNVTYSDVSALALKILIENPDIRKNEKLKTNAIMIDEFQDNNEMQKFLLFLLAEPLDRDNKSIPQASELLPNKLFFVGDEKQSIYRFRGADVGVFRSLKKDFPKTLSLSTNYRSHPQLIASFNSMFGSFEYTSVRSTYDKNYDYRKVVGTSSIFLQDYQLNESKDFPQFEAEYTKIFSIKPNETDDIDKKRIHICLLDSTKDDLEESTDEIDEIVSEDIVEAESLAIFTAEKIAELCKESYKPNDIAILFRSYSTQSLYEKHLRRVGVPYVTENITNFFGDAPVNDMLALLRLLVYPADCMSYATILRSPFIRLSQQDALSCLLLAENSSNKDIVFCEENAINLQGDAKENYKRSLNRYKLLREKVHTASCTQILCEIWYNDGYRYETMWNNDVFMFHELFDYLFDIANKVDLDGNTILYFVDYLYDLYKNDERLDDINIPLERLPAVQLMSIHKSKGLEFPVVFVANTSSKGRNSKNLDKVYIDKIFGPSLNFPLVNEIIDGKKNYFFDASSNIEDQMIEAELRRILYVAMTRAEKELYITASFSVNKGTAELLYKSDLPYVHTSKDTSEKDLFVILQAIFDEKQNSMKSKKNDTQVKYNYCIQNGTLFALILPVIAMYTESNAPFSLEVINKKNRADLFKKNNLIKNLSVTHVKDKVAKVFEKAFVVQTDKIESSNRSPSQISHADFFDIKESDNYDNGENAIPSLDVIIASKDNKIFDYSHFGTLCHIYAESLFTKRAARIPSIIANALSDEELEVVCNLAISMVNNFSTSPTGLEALRSEWFKTEFNFKLILKNNIYDNVFINGQIDLLYKKKDETLVILDYKTDSIEKPADHFAQLAAYKKAVSKIYAVENSQISCVLFYLRTGNTVDVTKEVDSVDLESLVFG